MGCTVLKGMFFLTVLSIYNWAQGEVLWIPSDGMIQPRPQVT